MYPEYVVTITYETHDIPWPTCSMSVNHGHIRYVAMMLEHSPYVRSFKVEVLDGMLIGKVVKPSDFNFICPFGGQPDQPWYEGTKWYQQ